MSAPLDFEQLGRTPTSPLAEAALAYTARAWPVLPLRPGSKIPLISKAAGGRGVHDATADSAIIAAQWAACPNANVGLACGAAFWVLDVDYDGLEATEPDGLTSLAALRERFGPLPATVTSLTGGGGFQFLFKTEHRVRNGVRVLPGLDTRSAGGYITAPPSLHPSGRTYSWRRGHGPDEMAIATAPPWLVALLEPVEVPAAEPRPAPATLRDTGRDSDAALARACDAIAVAPIGHQCDTLDRQSFGIGRLVAGGALPRGDALAALAAAGCCMTNAPRRRPWTFSQIEARIERAFRQAASRPQAAA